MNTVYSFFSRTLAGPDGTAHARRSKKRRQRQEAELARLLDQQPDPLPSPRAHNLSAPTLPLSPAGADDAPQDHDHDHNHQQEQSTTTSALPAVNPQTQSLLFATLPPELRERVWRSVVGGHVVWLTHIRKRIVGQTVAVPEAVFAALTRATGASATAAAGAPPRRSSAAESPPFPPPEDNNDNTSPSLSLLPPRPAIPWADHLDRTPLPTHTFPGPASAVALLRSSRAVYMEAHPLLYTSNVFALSSPLTLDTLATQPVLRPQHLARLRHLRLHWRFLHDPESVNGCVHAPWDAATWRRAWALLADRQVLAGIRTRRGGTLGVFVEVEGSEVEVFGAPAVKRGKKKKKTGKGKGRDAGEEEREEEVEEDEDDREGGEWVKAMMAVRGMQGAEVRLEWRIGPVNVQRLPHLEAKVKEAWAREEREEDG